MPLLELHIQADKSGEPPAKGEPWPFSHVELRSDPPKTWRLSEPLVQRGLADGWVRYEGKALAYNIEPDPLGEAGRYLSPQKVHLPGSVLVLTLTLTDAQGAAGEVVEVAYAITQGPVPVGFRRPDDSDPSGFSAEHDFVLRLKAAK